MNIYHLIPSHRFDLEVLTAIELAIRQRDDGNYVEIVCRPNSEVFSHARELEFPVSTLNFNGISDLDSAVRLGRIIKRRRNCVIFAHTFRVAFTACMARSFAENYHVKIILMRHVVKRAKHSMIFRKLYRDIDCIVFPSTVARSRFMLSRPGVDPEKVKLIHWSVPTLNSSKFDLHKTYNIPQNRVIFVYSGDVERGNGVRSLLRAASQLDHDLYHLIIARNCTKKSYARALNEIIVSNAMEGNVTFAGISDNKAIINLAASADVGVIPAVGKLAWSPQALGYMSCGVPVIVANNGAQADYIDGSQTGLLVSENNPYSLAEAMQRIVSDTFMRESMSKKALESYNSLHSYDIFADRISKLCSELLNDSPKS